MSSTDKPASAGAPDSEAREEEPSTVKTVVGCMRLLLIPALVIFLVFFAKRVNQPWMTWTALAVLVLYIGLKFRNAFRTPERTAESIVGGRPHDAIVISEKVVSHVTGTGILTEGETILAALDDSWTDNGTRGVIITDQRIIAYRKSAVRLDVSLADVETLSVRQMGYPGSEFLGRGEFFGEGPVTVLRLKFKMTTGATSRLRLSTYANQLYPVVAALLERLGERVIVRRSLPGF